MQRGFQLFLGVPFWLAQQFGARCLLRIQTHIPTSLAASLTSVKLPLFYTTGGFNPFGVRELSHAGCAPPDRLVGGREAHAGTGAGPCLVQRDGAF